ncbi:hypothetical protein CLU79DRAFT_725162 [Phycomyces nitens]|nr:hypothetical protein CLU79DRAFT_725162 [Phycomyces nitens]
MFAKKDMEVSSILSLLLLLCLILLSRSPLGSRTPRGWKHFHTKVRGIFYFLAKPSSAVNALKHRGWENFRGHKLTG